MLLLGVFLFKSCTSSKSAVSKAQSTTQQVFIFQNGKETLLNGLSQTVEVEKSKFSIRFYNKRYNPDAKEFYAAQIAAFLDKSVLDKIKVGMSKSEIPCFQPGTGMAPYESGKYEYLILDNSAHHYTFYENAESKRLNLLGESGEYLHLEFEISGLSYDNKKIKMTKTDLNKFYLAFLIDRNQNERIDKGELQKLTVIIK